MEKNAKIYVAGHQGMVGSAIVRNLKSKGYKNFVFTPYPKYDLINQKTVKDFFRKEKPEYVIDAAAKVGGINANNTLRAQFIYENLMIQNNIVHQSYLNGVKKLLFLGSSCIYPKMASQPLKEEYLLKGELEQTNEPYSIAKIAGIKMCENYFRQYGSQFFSIMPTNSYGPNDNYDLETSHVLPALIRKFHEAKINNSKEVILWGTGKPLREFIYVDDIADAIFFIMHLDFNKLYNLGCTHLNVGTGVEISITKLAQLIAKTVGYSGEIKYDTTMPDGTPRKLLDVSRLKELGWNAKIHLKEGLRLAYNWFLENYGEN
ncbi:MAG: GDP-L-fucose synthase [Armatimonadetes bacterium]|nr:GDP-L-fucose synthase [Armatimonadota bacterium]